MPPKSERFELRLEEDFLSRVDKWRSHQADVPSRAEAMRRLMETALSLASDETVKLSAGEKITIALLCDLTRRLKTEEEPEWNVDLISEAVGECHPWALKWHMGELVSEKSDSPADVKFVCDVLDMWTFLESAFEALSQREKEQVEKEVYWHEFTGFDGNNEIDLMYIARFVVEKMKRFSHFEGRDFDAHTIMVDRYKKMLDIFNPVRATLVGRNLKASEIIAIMKF